MIAFQFVALLDRVAYECAVSRDEILSKSRAASVSDARAIAVYCTRRTWGVSYPRLAELFRRSSSGVQYLEHQTQALVEHDKRVRAIVRRVLDQEIAQ